MSAQYSLPYDSVFTAEQLLITGGAGLHKRTSHATVQLLGCREPHLAPLCQLPCHNPMKDVLPDWHIEDAARKDNVPNLIVLPIQKGNGNIRALGLWHSPAMRCKAA